METLKDIFNQFKWVLLAGIMVAVLVALITANLHVLQFMKYKMQNDTSGVISVLQVQSRNASKQDDWFFAQGMKYLLEQEEYTEELTTFFEEGFNSFEWDWQKEIIKGYNKRGLFLPMSEEVMTVLKDSINEESTRSYMKRLEPEIFEQGLIYIFGDKPQVTQTLIDGLYSLLSVYSKQLIFDKFQFDLYEALNYAGENVAEKVELIISKISPEQAKSNIFSRLRTQDITEEQLCNWMEFFNTTGIIAENEYAQFKNTYGNICLIRSQYKQLDGQQIELKNKKDVVDAQISESVKTLAVKQAELSSTESEISKLESTLDSMTNFLFMNLYIERTSGTGSGEYIASSPRSGIFGPRPSDLKYIVQLQSTSFSQPGIYNVSVYYKGIKKGTSGEEYGYYVEVSASDTSSIEDMKRQRSEKLNALTSLKSEISELESQISAVKKENHYDDIESALKNIVLQRDEYKKQVNEEVIHLRQLFGLSNINISI